MRALVHGVPAELPPAAALREYNEAHGTAIAIRQVRYLNNVVEQDHRFVKHRVNPGPGFGAFATAQRTIQGYEAMYMLRKGQRSGLAKGDILGQIFRQHWNDILYRWTRR